MENKHPAWHGPCERVRTRFEGLGGGWGKVTPSGGLHACRAGSDPKVPEGRGLGVPPGGRGGG